MSTAADYFGLESPVWQAANDLFGLSTIAEEDEVAPLHHSAHGGGEGETPFLEDAPPVKRRKIVATCASCGQQFTEKRSLYRHERTSRTCNISDLAQEHHPCSTCGRVFSRADTLSRHEKEHHQFLGRKKTTDVVHGASSLPSSNTSLGVLGDQAMPLWDGNTQSGSFEPNDIYEMDLERNVTSRLATADDVSGSDQGVPATSRTYSDSVDHPTDTQADLRIRAGPATHVTTDDDSRSVRSTTSISSLIRTFKLPFRSSSSLERLGASRGFSAFKNIPPCPACKKPFESNSAKLIQHVQSHVRDWEREFVCSDCEIGFQCQDDFALHMTSASRGSCGFIASDHSCTGHHPPYESGNQAELTSHDRLTLCTFLRHWEQAQLEALIVGLDELSLRNSNLDSDRWSLSLLRRRPSSICSSAVIPPSFRSEPKYLNVKVGKAATIRTIEQRLGRISNVGLSSLIRRQAAENEALLRTEALNKSLARAIVDENLDLIEVLLDSGAEINARLQRNPHPLEALLWYHSGEIVHLHPEFVTPLALARLHACTRAAGLLESFGASDDLVWERDLKLRNVRGLGMVLEPPGFAPSAVHILRVNAIALNQRNRRYRAERAMARELSAFTNAPTSFRAPWGRLIQHLIRVNHSLGLQAALELGASSDAVLPNGLSPLHYALQCGFHACVLVLLNHGIKTDETTVRELVTTRAIGLNILEFIRELASEGFWKQAQHLFDQIIKSLPETSQPRVCTFVLSRAIETSSVSILELILKNDKSCLDEWPSRNSAKDTRGDFRRSCGSPLGFAAWHGLSDVVKFFLSYGADLAKIRGRYGTPLRIAVSSGNVDIVQLLLDAGADPNQTLSGYRSLLFWATRVGSVEIASALVRSGAYLDENAMVIAAYHGRLDLAKYFLELNADINYNDAKIGTPICAALSKLSRCSNYLDMVEFLLNNGADPAIVGPRGNALQLAISLRDKHEEKIIEQGAWPSDLAKMDEVIHLLREAVGPPQLLSANEEHCSHERNPDNAQQRQSVV